MQRDRLRIAFATQEYVTESSYDGGIANYIHRTASSLAASGHDVHVITLSHVDEAQFDHDGIKVHRVKFDKRWLQLNRLSRYRLTTTMHLLGLSAAVFRKLKQLNERYPFDLVQFPNCGYCGLFSILFLQIPHVLRASWNEPEWNASDELRRGIDSRTAALLERLQFRLSPNVYAPSLTLQKILTRNSSSARVRVIRPPCYLETTRWDYSVRDQFLENKDYCLFFGRFELRKGFHILAQALPAFLETHPNAHAVIVGRDKRSGLAPSMADYARSICGRVSDRLLLIEQLPHSRLYPIIEGARAVVLPSLIDNMPNACLEAMALGKVVIGTRGASFDELIENGKNGFLIEPNNVAALAKVLIEVWSNEELDRIGRAARQTVERLAPETTVPSLINYYREVLQE